MRFERAARIVEFISASTFLTCELRFGDLHVEVKRPRPEDVATKALRAPGVGVFHASTASDGCVGSIACLDEKLEVQVPLGMRVAKLVAGDGQFVEYGETVAELASVR